MAAINYNPNKQGLQNICKYPTNHENHNELPCNSQEFHSIDVSELFLYLDHKPLSFSFLGQEEQMMGAAAKAIPADFLMIPTPWVFQAAFI